MRSLPLFHRIAGQPVIVLGEGQAAEPKRKLVERAGGAAINGISEGIAKGARLAFVAHDDQRLVEADAARLRGLGILINAVDRPELCDFTVPSLLERDPVLVAVGTSGASAGLAKQLRLRLEALLPPALGGLAEALQSARGRLRSRWPNAADRRRALDGALGPGGALDLLSGAGAAEVDDWLAKGAPNPPSARAEIRVLSDDPEDLTLRQARLLGTADILLIEPGLPDAILNRARADALRRPLDFVGDMAGLVVVELRRA